MRHRRFPFVLVVLVAVSTSAQPARSVGQVPTCIVTKPPTPSFVLPIPVVAAPIFRWKEFWYGTDALWTRLRVDGRTELEYTSSWWHPGFDGLGEPHPALRITATELHTRTRVRTSRANAVADPLGGGWMMLTRLALPTTGCWVVTATYQSAFVSYVVEAVPVSVF